MTRCSMRQLERRVPRLKPSSGRVRNLGFRRTNILAHQPVCHASHIVIRGGTSQRALDIVVMRYDVLQLAAEISSVVLLISNDTSWPPAIFACHHWNSDGQ